MQWMDQAVCREVDPELFVGERETTEREEAFQEAVGVCSRCPVREPCLEYAINLAARDTIWGIWGGLAAKDIHALAYKQARAA